MRKSFALMILLLLTAGCVQQQYPYPYSTTTYPGQTTTTSPYTTTTTKPGVTTTTVASGSWKCCVQGRNTYTCRQSCIFLIETQVGYATYISESACKLSCPFSSVSTSTTSAVTTTTMSNNAWCSNYASTHAWGYWTTSQPSMSDCNDYAISYCNDMGYGYYGAFDWFPSYYCCVFGCGALLPTTTTIPMTGPADCSNWASSLGHSHWFYDVVYSLDGCEQYASDWCTANGEPGSNWLSSFDYSNKCCIWSCHGEVQ